MADYSESGAGVTVDLVAGTVRGGDAEGDTLAGVENLIGSRFDGEAAETAGPPPEVLAELDAHLHANATTLQPAAWAEGERAGRPQAAGVFPSRLKVNPVTRMAGMSATDLDDLQAAIDARRRAGHLAKLHLGGGPNRLDGWIDTDLHPQGHALRLDVARPCPLEDACADCRTWR